MKVNGGMPILGLFIVILSGRVPHFFINPQPVAEQRKFGAIPISNSTFISYSSRVNFLSTGFFLSSNLANAGHPSGSVLDNPIRMFHRYPSLLRVSSKPPATDGNTTAVLAGDSASSLGPGISCSLDNRVQG